METSTIIVIVACALLAVSVGLLLRALHVIRIKNVAAEVRQRNERELAAKPEQLEKLKPDAPDAPKRRSRKKPGPKE